LKKKKKKCWNCDETGHLQKECKEPQKEVEGADCDVCKIFVKKIHVQYHYEGVRHAKNVKRATGPPPEKKDCTICNITLIGEAQYNAHLEGKKHKKKMESPNKSENQSKFQCDLCPKAPYTTLGALNLHKRRQHDMTASKELQFTKFQCDMCNNPPFLTNIALMNHKSKVHVGHTLDSGASSSSTAVPRFQCNLCSKPPFFTSVALLNHKTKAHWPTRGNPITNGFKRDLPKNPLLDDEEDPLKSEGESDAVADEDVVGNRQSNGFDGLGSEVVLLDDEDETDDGGVLSPYNSEDEADPVVDEDAFGNPKNDFKRDVEFDSNFIDVSDDE